MTLGLFVRSFNVARNNMVLESEVLGSTPNVATYEPQCTLLNHHGLSFLLDFHTPKKQTDWQLLVIVILILKEFKLN